jgi:flagellar capping protein FliD
VQSSILNDATYAISGNSGFVNLASLGINTNNDGTLTVGSTPSGQTVAEVLANNPLVVQNFFQNASGTGFANNFNSDLRNLTDATQGPLNVELAQNNSESQDLTKSISSFELQLAAEQTSLTKQYDSVNASLQAYPLLLQEITQTLGTLGASTSGSGATVSSSPTLTSGL